MPDSPSLTAEDHDNQADEQAPASGALRPSVQAALTLKDFNSGPFPNLDLFDLVSELGTQINACSDGDLSRAEASLVTQAHLLDAIFGHLARRSFMNMGEYLGAAESYMKLALKAQNQARATWESLARMKSPQAVAFVRNANIAQNQQINFGESEETRVLEAAGHERLDFRATEETGRGHPSLEAVGEVDGA